MENTRWEVTLLEIEANGRIKYKVTRRYPSLSIAETKVFNSKEEAKEQFDAWLY